MISGIQQPEVCRPAFEAYEIHGVRDFDDEGGKYCEQVPDDEAEFWTLYGHIPSAGLESIGDLKTRAFAEEVYERITGERYPQNDDFPSEWRLGQVELQTA